MAIFINCLLNSIYFRRSYVDASVRENKNNNSVLINDDGILSSEIISETEGVANACKRIATEPAIHKYKNQIISDNLRFKNSRRVCIINTVFTKYKKSGIDYHLLPVQPPITNIIDNANSNTRTIFLLAMTNMVASVDNHNINFLEKEEGRRYRCYCPTE